MYITSPGKRNRKATKEEVMFAWKVQERTFQQDGTNLWKQKTFKNISYTVSGVQYERVTDKEAVTLRCSRS